MYFAGVVSENVDCISWDLKGDQCCTVLKTPTQHNILYTGCFTTLGYNCRRWFPRSLWSIKFI